MFYNAFVNPTCCIEKESRMKFVWTPTNVLVLALRFLALTIPYWICSCLWFAAEQLDRMLDWLSEALPQVKLSYEPKDEE